jgi:hypothetical protein
MFLWDAKIDRHRAALGDGRQGLALLNNAALLGQSADQAVARCRDGDHLFPVFGLPLFYVRGRSDLEQKIALPDRLPVLDEDRREPSVGLGADLGAAVRLDPARIGGSVRRSAKRLVGRERSRDGGT